MSRFSYLCPIRWGDLDAQGHVNNAVYVDYLQEARVEFLLTGPAVLRDMLASGVLVVSHQIEYLRPIGFDMRPVEIQLWVQAVGGSRFEIGYDVFHHAELVGRARTGAVPYDLAGPSLRRLRPEERAQLAARMDTGTPLRALDRVGLGGHPHRFPFRVRWSDLDSYGHVNNVKFYDYVQEARLAMVIEAVGFSTDEVWVIARQDLEYHRPLDFRLAEYEVATAVSGLGNRSITLTVEVRDPGPGTVYATARTVLVGPASLHDDERAALLRWAAR